MLQGWTQPQGPALACPLPPGQRTAKETGRTGTRKRWCPPRWNSGWPGVGAPGPERCTPRQRGACPCGSTDCEAHSNTAVPLRPAPVTDGCSGQTLRTVVSGNAINPQVCEDGAPKDQGAAWTRLVSGFSSFPGDTSTLTPAGSVRWRGRATSNLVRQASSEGAASAGSWPAPGGWWRRSARCCWSRATERKELLQRGHLGGHPHQDTAACAGQDAQGPLLPPLSTSSPSPGSRLWSPLEISQPPSRDHQGRTGD